MQNYSNIQKFLHDFVLSKKMINKYLSNLKLMATKRHHPMELKLHQIYEKE